MKIQHVIQLVVMLAANSALAFPIHNINRALQQGEPENCQRSSQTNNFRDLIVKVAVMGEDDRKPLSKNLQVVGFSATEVEQAMRCTGHIFCPGGLNGLGSMQSAGSICAPGERRAGGFCAADRLGSVGHMFIDKATNRFIPQIDKCEFRNYRGHSSKLEVNDLNVIDSVADANNPHKNMRADKLVVRLKKPIPGCDPYDLNESPSVPQAGTKLIALTHIHKDQGGKLDGSEPLAYNCQVTRSFPARNGGPGLFYNDCDLNGVGSGGFSLIRGADNKLKVAGLFIRSGFMERNGQPYDEEYNYTIAVGTNADFAQLASRPGVKPAPQLTQGEVPTPALRPASGN